MIDNELLYDIVNRANIEGLRGNRVIGIAQNNSAACSPRYGLVVEKYVVKSASDEDLRIG